MENSSARSQVQYVTGAELISLGSQVVKENAKTALGVIPGRR